MDLYDEAIIFKDKNGLYFHPLHDAKKRISDIEWKGGHCPCRPGRQCVCDQALNDIKEKGSCACLLFDSREYLVKWCYVDEKGRFLSEKERKLLIKKREKEKKEGVVPLE